MTGFASFGPFIAAAAGVSSLLAGCGGGSTTSTSTLSPYDSHVKWSVDFMVGDTTAYMFRGGPSVGADGTVFVPVTIADSSEQLNDALLALNGHDGSSKWEYPVPVPLEAEGVPAISPDESVYFQASLGKNQTVQAVNGDGSKKWVQQLWNSSEDWRHPPVLGLADARSYQSLALGSDGTVFVSKTPLDVGVYDDIGLFALDGDDGSVKWQFNPEGGNLSFFSPTVAPDNTVFVGASPAGEVFAVHGADGSLKWKSALPGSATELSSLTLGADGTVLMCSLYGLFAIDSRDGSEAWHQPAACLERATGASNVRPAVGADGTVFVAGRADGSDMASSLLALHGGNGSIKWSAGFPGEALGSAAVSSDGTVYAIGYHGLRALDATDGSVRWYSSLSEGSSWYGLNPEPVLGPDGTVYVADKGLLIAFHGEGGPVTVPYDAGLAQLVSLV